MTSIKRALFLVLLISLNLSCSNEIIVDGLYPSVIMNFEIIDASEGIKIEHYKDGRFVKVFDTDGVYCLETGEMRGGYTLVGEQKVNVHDPLHYKIFRIDWPGVGQRDLSIHDIESLSFNEIGGQEIFQLTQLAFLKIQSRNMINYPKVEPKEDHDKPKDGAYLFNLVYGEGNGITTGKKVDVVIYGNEARIISVEGSSPGLVRQGEVIEEGKLIQDQHGKWIITDSEIPDLSSIRREHCSDRPSEIDFVNKLYIRC